MQIRVRFEVKQSEEIKYEEAEDKDLKPVFEVKVFLLEFIDFVLELVVFFARLLDVVALVFVNATVFLVLLHGFESLAHDDLGFCQGFTFDGA